MVGSLTLELHIPASNSLKAKRSVLNSVKERIKNKFSASVAEVDNFDLWQRATIGVAVVSSEKGIVENILASVVRLVEADGRVNLLDYQIDFL
ncbi:MAG: DUF503 domain-containing protein [Candidatus Eisenbacteria bacterium]|nr:DUF503 domain-containing protein [Candidatus Eisenbacteria bacterium]